MEKQSHKTEQTRQAFLDAFCSLYSKKPIQNITVQEISGQAGFNRVTFYEYFSGIDELLEHIENDVLNCIKRKHPKMLSIEADMALIQETIKFYEEKGTYLNALMGKYGSNRFSEKFKAKIPYNENQFSLYDENKTTAYLIEFRNSAALSLFQFWQRRKKDMSMEELAGLIVSLYNEGISGFIKRKNKKM